MNPNARWLWVVHIILREGYEFDPLDCWRIMIHACVFVGGLFVEGFYGKSYPYPVNVMHTFWFWALDIFAACVCCLDSAFILRTFAWSSAGATRLYARIQEFFPFLSSPCLFRRWSGNVPPGKYPTWRLYPFRNLLHSPYFDLACLFHRLGTTLVRCFTACLQRAHGHAIIASCVRLSTLNFKEIYRAAVCLLEHCIHW